MTDSGDIVKIDPSGQTEIVVRHAPIGSVHCSDSGIFLIAGRDKTVYQYNDQGKLLGHSPLQEDFIRDIIRLPDSGYFGAATYAGIRVYSLSTLTETGFYAGYPGWIFSGTAFGRFLAGGGSDSSLRIWDRSDPSTVRDLTGYAAFIRKVFYFTPSSSSFHSANPDSLFSGYLLEISDREIIVRTFTSGAIVRRKTIDIGDFGDAALDPQSARLTLATDQAVMVFSVPDLTLISSRPISAEQIRFSADGESLFFISQGMLYRSDILSHYPGLQNCRTESGAIVRMDSAHKTIRLVFTGHGFGEGGMAIADALLKHQAKASFFLTGDFYRNPANAPAIRRLKSDGHYLGGHSDHHILYCSSDQPGVPVISCEAFRQDIAGNYRAMKDFGIEPADAPFFLPPFEKYNARIADWAAQMGLVLINYTPGTLSNQDYSIPSMGKAYRSSQTIVDDILRYDHAHPDGLNGFILLFHIGSHPERTDKFYHRLNDLLNELKLRGYRMDRF